MEITREQPRSRWLIMSAVWAFVAVIAVWHTQATRAYVGLLDQGGRPGLENATPLRRAGDANAIAIMQQRLAAYQANRPWRQ
ncbi:MAG: hypothetical protein EXS37_07985 [Opitutus sp.]|nr:hypothetical protein [Opitutus sp.]